MALALVQELRDRFEKIEEDATIIAKVVETIP